MWFDIGCSCGALRKHLHCSGCGVLLLPVGVTEDSAAWLCKGCA